MADKGSPSDPEAMWISARPTTRFTPSFLSPVLLCPRPALHPSPASSQTAESCKLWGPCVNQLSSAHESSSWDLSGHGLPWGARLSAIPQKDLNYRVITLEIWLAKPGPSEKAPYVRTEADACIFPAASSLCLPTHPGVSHQPSLSLDGLHCTSTPPQRSRPSTACIGGSSKKVADFQPRASYTSESLITRNPKHLEKHSASCEPQRSWPLPGQA